MIPTHYIYIICLMFQVTKKLSEIKYSMSSGVSENLKLKQFFIINENRQIEPVDLTINLCDPEL